MQAMKHTHGPYHQPIYHRPDWICNLERTKMKARSSGQMYSSDPWSCTKYNDRKKYHISELDILNVQISLVANNHDGKEKKCKDDSESVQKHMQICLFALFLACSLPCLFI